MFVYICRCAVRTVTVPSGLSDVLLRDQSFCASKIMRELKHSIITKDDFARDDSFQKHYPHTRGNAADSPTDIFHTFYHPCRVSTTKKGKAGLQPGSGTTGAAGAAFQMHSHVLPS